MSLIALMAILIASCSEQQPGTGMEAGGTKMVCSLGNENGDVLERESFPTTTPEETMPLLIGLFELLL